MNTRVVYQKNLLRPRYLLLLTTALALLFFSFFVFQTRAAKAESTLTASPAVAPLGSTFVISGSGYLAGEIVPLWTTDPNGTALQAGYTIADKYGDILVNIETKDPEYLASNAGTNYTVMWSSYNNYQVEVPYLRVVLYAPQNGNWSLSAYDKNANTTNIYKFTIGAPLPAANGTASPTSAALGSVVTVQGGGFWPGELVSLWTTDPNGAALAAGYTYADSNGNIKVHVESSNPGNLAFPNGNNLGLIGTTNDSNGNVVDSFLRVVLKSPQTGVWSLSAYSALSGGIQVTSFTLS